MNESLLQLSTAVKLSDIREYLRLLGWAPVLHRNDRVELYRNSSPALAPVELVLPRSSEVADYAKRVVDIANTLGMILKKAPEAVIHQFLEFGQDVLNTRIVGMMAEESSIPLDLAVRVVESLKKLLVYGGAGEVSHLPFFVKPGAKAKATGERCRFGHTFKGSFGFTIESPLPPIIPSPLFDEDPAEVPFERRVIERVYRGIANARQATLNRDITPIIENYETGLNANMCDALKEMSESVSREDFVFSVNWSPRIPESMALAGLSEVRLNAASREYLEQASIQLRSLEESREVTIEGRVVLLKSDSSPWEDEPEDEHTVVIAWLDTDGKAVRTRVVLSPTNYLEACKAHMEGQGVSVSGTLEKRGKYSRLTNPHDFGPGSQRSLFPAGEDNPL
jgi:hypothetical protein